MARGTIITKTLGKIVALEGGRHSVIIPKKQPRAFETEEKARQYLERNGAKRYVTVIRLNGRQKWKTFTKRKEADDYLDRHAIDNRDGTYKEIKKATFEQYVKHWKATYMIPEKLKPSTMTSYGSTIDRHLVPEFGPSSLQAIDTARVTRFEARLLQEGLSRTTVRGVLVLLGRLFRDARREGYLKVSPMMDVAKPRQQKSKKGRALKPDEVHRLLEHCDDTLRVIVLIALLSGLRRSELFALHWTDDPSAPRSFVDFDHDVIRVRKAVFFRHGKHHVRKEGEPAYVFVPPKSRQSVRDVPLSPALKRELLARYMESGDKKGLIFQTAGGHPVDANNVCRWKPKRKDGTPRQSLDPSPTFTGAVDLSGIGAVRFHDLRHTYGSVKVDQGENIYDVQRWMGHSSIQVTIDIYGHPMTDRGQEAAAKTDAVYFGAGARD